MPTKTVHKETFEYSGFESEEEARKFLEETKKKFSLPNEELGWEDLEKFIEHFRLPKLFIGFYLI